MLLRVGPSLIARFRPDLLENFSDRCDYQSVADYIYHCNAQEPRSADRHVISVCVCDDIYILFWSVVGDIVVDI